VGAIEPTREQLRAFAEGPEDGPVVMINLLRFRERAAYAADAGETPCSGQEAYGRYSAAVGPLLAGVGGRPIWVGLGRHTVIAPEGEAWDQAILVEYPSRKAFLDMVTSPAYQAVVHHRTAALADSRLIATSGTELPPRGGAELLPPASTQE
jgi:uncharacterized protein (DUF1330 family)